MHAFHLHINRSSCERATFLLRYFRSHGVGVTYVRRIEVATNLRRFFCKLVLKKCRTLENEAIVQRRSATLKAFDSVALQWLSLRFQYDALLQADPQLCVGSFNGPDH